MTNQIRILDLETTGFGSDDEILQIGIIDQSGNVLMNQFIKPVVCELNDRWAHSVEVHGITPEKVVNCPSLASVLPAFVEITKGFHVVIYNKAFDLRFFDKRIVDYFGKVSCCMNEFTARNSKKKVTLEVASKIVGFDFDSSQAHDAIYDCRATLAVWEWLNSDK